MVITFDVNDFLVDAYCSKYIEHSMEFRITAYWCRTSVRVKVSLILLSFREHNVSSDRCKSESCGAYWVVWELKSNWSCNLHKLMQTTFWSSKLQFSLKVSYLVDSTWVDTNTAIFLIVSRLEQHLVQCIQQVVFYTLWLVIFHV